MLYVIASGAEGPCGNLLTFEAFLLVTRHFGINGWSSRLSALRRRTPALAPGASVETTNSGNL